MSVVYSILFIYFLSLFGETIAWICVVILQLGFIAVPVIGWYMWDKASKELITDEEYPDPEILAAK